MLVFSPLVDIKIMSYIFNYFVWCVEKVNQITLICRNPAKLNLLYTILKKLTLHPQIINTLPLPYPTN